MFAKALQKILVGYFLSLPLSVSTAHAGGVWSQILSKCAALLETPYQQLVEVNSQQTLLLNARIPGTPHAQPTLIGLALAKRLGAGFFGQVVILDQITDPFLDRSVRQVGGRSYTGPLVVKIPHALRKLNFGMALPYTNAENQGEWLDYQMLQSQVGAIAAHPAFPKNPAWNPKVLPLAPISGVLETERGLLIFKPLIRGLDLKAIAKLTQSNGFHLATEMQEGLRNHYQFIQAVYGVVKPPRQALLPFLPSKPGKEGFATDIRPPNLMWLPGDTAEQKQQLALLGYSRPGFIAFEMAQVPGNTAQYIQGQGLSFEEYQAEFEDYLRGALEK